MEKSHARDTSRKDGVLQELLNDMEAAEEQFVMAKRAHLRALDRLVDQQDSRLLQLEEEFQTRTAELQDTFAAEMDDLRGQHSVEVMEMRHLQEVLEARQEERRREAQDDYEQRKNALQSNAMERMNSLQNDMDGRIDALSTQFDEAHSDYIRMTDDRTKKYKDLRKKDAWHDNKIQEMKVREKELMREVQRYRVKLANMSRDEQARIDEMERRKMELLKHHMDMKRATRIARQRSARRLRQLSNAGTGTRATLGSATALAESILGLAEQCRALESEEEKVAPFDLPGTAVHPDELTAIEGPSGLEAETFAAGLAGLEARAGAHFDTLTRATREASADADHLSDAPDMIGSEPSPLGFHDHFPQATDEAGYVVSGAGLLSRFHRRLNKATLERLALKQQRDRLANENSKLQGLMQSFLRGVSLSDGALEGRNPLFLVNDTGFSAAASAEADRPGVPTAVDGPRHFATLRGSGIRR